MARVTQQEAANTSLQPQEGPASVPSRDIPTGEPQQGRLCPISTPPRQGQEGGDRKMPTHIRRCRENLAHISHLLPRGDDTGSTTYACVKRDIWGHQGSAPQPGCWQGCLFHLQRPCARQCQQGEVQGTWLQAHPTPLPPFQPWSGVPTRLEVTGQAGPCPMLKAGTPTPAQAQGTWEGGAATAAHGALFSNVLLFPVLR